MKYSEHTYKIKSIKISLSIYVYCSHFYPVLKEAKEFPNSYMHKLKNHIYV